MEKKVFMITLSLIFCFLVSGLVFAQSQGSQQQVSNSKLETKTSQQSNLTISSRVISPESRDSRSNMEIGEGHNFQQQSKVKLTYAKDDPNVVQIKQQINNKTELKYNNTLATTTLEIVQNSTQNQNQSQKQSENQSQNQFQNQFSAKLSNGRNAEIKIMPDVASEKALEQLQIKMCSEENECQIELKEVGKKDNIQAAYEINVQKQAKVFGLFKAKMQVQAQINAENGEIIQEKKPWWAFLASESEE